MFFIEKPTGFEIKNLPTDQQQCGIPRNNKNLLQLFNELNPGINFVKNLDPFNLNAFCIIKLTPKKFSKKLNNKAEDDNHINIHLPISTNKNIGKNAIN